MGRRNRRLVAGISIPGWIFMVYGIIGAFSTMDWLTGKLIESWAFVRTVHGQVITFSCGLLWLTGVVLWPELRARRKMEKRVRTYFDGTEWPSQIGIRLVYESPRPLHKKDLLDRLQRMGLSGHEWVIQPMLASCLVQSDALGYLSPTPSLESSVRFILEHTPILPAA